MYGIFWVLMIGAVSWLIGDISGQGGYAQMLTGQAGWRDMIFGIVGASVGSSLFVFRSSIR